MPLHHGLDAINDLCRVFAGRPPDILLADLSTAPDCLPLHHVGHLLQPDWPAYTDDFLLPPYAPGEALARLSLLVFRQRHICSSDTLVVQNLVIDLSGGCARDVGGGGAAGNKAGDRLRAEDLAQFELTDLPFGRADAADWQNSGRSLGLSRWRTNAGYRAGE